MMKNYEETIEKLKKYNQNEIVNIMSKVYTEEENKKLIEQLNRIDLNQVMNLYENANNIPLIDERKIEHIEYTDLNSLSEEKFKEYKNIGIDVIKNNKYAVITMAGGQGTRLGHTGPKGTFKLDVYGKGKYLFEILAENLKDANKKYNTIIPWYIMTSKENNDQTQEFLEKNNYFGYDKNSVMLFEQGELPLVDTEGKMLISKDLKIKEASDGNGGVFSSLRTSGMLADMKERGIKWVFIGGVDNCLVKMVDPVLMGIAIDKGVTVACKSVVKANPYEKVGVFCRRNGKPNVIEYSEITEEMAEAVDENGELLYGESHILCNLFNVKAIERMGANPLPYHVAYKKAKYIDKDGNLVVPDSPNAYKFEAFLFDAFGKVDDMAILRVKREEEFAPVKNSDSADVDCPRTARKLYKQFHHLD